MRKSDRNSATLIAYFCNKNIIAKYNIVWNIQRTDLQSKICIPKRNRNKNKS